MSVNSCRLVLLPLALLSFSEHAHAVFQGAGALTPVPTTFSFSAFGASSCNAASASYVYAIKHIYADSNCVEVELSPGTAFATKKYWQIHDCHLGAGGLHNFGVWPAGNPTCSGAPESKTVASWSHHDISGFEALDATCKLAPSPMQVSSFPLYATASKSAGAPASVCSMFCPMKCGNNPPLTPPSPPSPPPPSPPDVTPRSPPGLPASPTPPAPPLAPPSSPPPPPPEPPLPPDMTAATVGATLGTTFGGVAFVLALILVIRHEIKKYHEAKVMPFTAGQTYKYWSAEEGKFKTPGELTLSPPRTMPQNASSTSSDPLPTGARFPLRCSRVNSGFLLGRDGPHDDETAECSAHRQRICRRRDDIRYH